MKKIISLFLLFCSISTCLVACKKIDDYYGVSSAAKNDTRPTPESETISIPKIKSDDSVMSSYLDISLYDEENYADIYLGEDFSYNITYAESELVVPSTYKEMIQNGWSLMESSEYGLGAQVLAGKSLSVEFVNEYDKKITAIFYNGKKSSVTLEKCPIVKFIIKENTLDPSSDYGQFWVNGINNISVTTDIIERLGYPSHFYKVSENKYYLDWFISPSDRRNGITIYIDTAEDHIDSIEFSYY